MNTSGRADPVDGPSANKSTSRGSTTSSSNSSETTNSDFGPATNVPGGTNDTGSPRHITNEEEHVEERMAAQRTLSSENIESAERGAASSSSSSSTLPSSEQTTVSGTLPSNLLSEESSKGQRKSRISGAATQPGAVAVQPSRLPHNDCDDDAGTEMIHHDGACDSIPRLRRPDADMSPTSEKEQARRCTAEDGGPMPSGPQYRAPGGEQARRTAEDGGVVATETVEEDSPSPMANVLPTEDGEASPPHPMPVEGDEGYLEDSNAPIIQNGSVMDADVTNVAHIIEAELAPTGETYDVEVERERIKQQAERDAQDRFLASAVTAEVKVVDDQDADNRLRRLKIYVAGAMVIVTILIVVLVVVFTIPTSDDIALSSTCETADGPLNTTGDFYTGVIVPREGDFSAACQVDEEGGFGQWYFLKGNGSPLRASTCEGSDDSANSDTQVLVFSGSCSSLRCVGGGDELCGSHASVGWMAEKNEVYFILVRGNRASSTGNFTLTISSLDENGECERAAKIENVTEPIFGSTRNHTLTPQIPSCDGAEESLAPGSWYEVEGDDTVKCVSVTTESDLSTIVFPVTTSIYSGNCGESTCVDSVRDTAEVAWMTNFGTTYYLLVQGEQVEDVGDYFLNLRDSPYNGICENAQGLSVGIVFNGTTVNACQEVDRICSPAGQEGLAGVWFSLKGTGNLMVASTCDAEVGTGSIVTHLTLYNSDGGCSTLGCVSSAKETKCGSNDNQRSIQWFSTLGEIYYILVRSSNPSSFVISVEDVLPDVQAPCDEAIAIDVDSESYSVGSTAGLGSMNATTIVPCSQSSLAGSTGVYYKVVATGGELTASTCMEGTDFATNISVFTGSCEIPECLDDGYVATCDGVRSVASWLSIEGQIYYIYVHGATDEDTGRFALTIKQGGIQVANDFCSTAQEVVIGSTVSGSTTNATLDSIEFCEEEETSPGVWYKLIGDGRSLSASLCGNSTNFDTQIRIYGGECNSLQCVGFNDDSCGTKSEFTWMSEEGIQYYIHISGFEGQVGDFDLLVSVT